MSEEKDEDRDGWVKGGEGEGKEGKNEVKKRRGAGGGDTWQEERGKKKLREIERVRELMMS